MKRIYLVGTGQQVRLVRAPNRAQALAHVARSTIAVNVASQDDLVKMLTAGIKVEDVSPQVEQTELEEAA
ncbi:MAG: hypothetical protein LW768_22120 [Rubrivivax sp.]|jgi:hypothetical protein|nr:hypothetical protein [Rubrivivax sp.]